jgi:diacylglycerol kinase family enzyme
MRTGDEILLITNPTSGRGRARAWSEAALAQLQREGRAARIVSTRDAAPAAAPAEEWVFGGDGTLREVLQQTGAAAPPISIFPTGTGNVVARALEIPRSLHGALANARSGTPHPFDLGRITVGEKGQRFAFMVSVGLDAELVRWVAERRKGPMRRHDWLFAAFACRHSEEPAFTIALDGRPPEPVRYAAIFNCGLYAGGFRVCPAARWNDGLFHVLTLREPILPRWRSVALAAWRGRPERLADASLTTARRVAIAGAPRSQVDGDPGPGGELLLEIEPAAVRLRGAAHAARGG